MSPPKRRIRANDLDLHVLDEGEGPPVLLLHGFRDSALLWRHQIPALVGAGFRTIAPDLRGFGESERPREKEAYQIHHVLSDLAAVLDALEIERAHVVGHDWGAAVGWSLASFMPDRVEQLVSMSVGHMSAFASAAIEQREKSWYMLFFQYEKIAEEALRRDGWRLFREWTRDHPECDKWIRDLERPGALTASLNWYRANMTPESLFAEPPAFPKVAADTLGLWSTGDAYLTEEQMIESGSFVNGSWRYERVDDATHWMQLDQPEIISRHLLAFLRTQSRVP
jgi:pimeloyl-ACP methyl ester carboxylesterase